MDCGTRSHEVVGSQLDGHGKMTSSSHSAKSGGQGFLGLLWPASCRGTRWFCRETAMVLAHTIIEGKIASIQKPPRNNSKHQEAKKEGIPTTNQKAHKKKAAVFTVYACFCATIWEFCAKFRNGSLLLMPIFLRNKFRHSKFLTFLISPLRYRAGGRGGGWNRQNLEWRNLAQQNCTKYRHGI